MSRSRVISFTKELEKLKFVGDRRPESTDKQLEGAFAELAPYRDGAIYIGHCTPSAPSGHIDLIV